MKKLLLITAAIVATLGVSYAANSFRDVKDASKCETGMKCSFCGGTGFKGNVNCFACKGSGRNGSY
jgi:DnaJ-class molecular chaperone